MYSSQRQEKKPTKTVRIQEFKTSLIQFKCFNKTLSWRAITRRLSNAGFVSRKCVKLLRSQKSIRHNEVFGRIKSGSAELCGVMNQNVSSLADLQIVWRSGEKNNRECISTTVKHGGRGVMVWGAFSAASLWKVNSCFGIQENIAERLASHNLKVVF